MSLYLINPFSDREQIFGYYEYEPCPHCGTRISGWGFDFVFFGISFDK